jgi:alkylation response protein AidB-like acyl-CoA dehydrogenase
MDFALNEEQLMLRAQVGRALGNLATPAAVAAHLKSARGFDAGLWRSVCDLGIPGLLEAALASEMMGRHAVPVPFLGSVIAAPLALTLAGSPVQRSTYLPRLAEGALQVGLAVSHALGGSRSPESLAFDGKRLNGVAQFAIDTDDMALLLVVDSAATWHLVAADALGLNIMPLDIVDRTRTASALRFEGVIPEETLPGKVLEPLGAALRVMVAADLLGAADRMLEIAVDYAKLRQQFGRLIGSFQAVKHLCADMAAAIEPGRSLIWYAAYAQDAALGDAALCALHAKAYMADAARVTARNATEVHGGIGITEELRLHHWFKRISFDGQLFGGATRLRESAAVLQGLGPVGRNAMQMATE